MKAHLLVFDTTQVERTVVRDLIDRMTVVEDWTLFFGNTMCLASHEPAESLARRVREALPNMRFLLTTIDATQTGGWLPKGLWQSINEPTPFRQKSDA